MAVITPTLDGDILALLAAGEMKLTGRAISHRIGASQEGARHALERLVGQGIVLREQAGRAHLYHLNRQHLAAPWIGRLAALRMELIERLRIAIRSWKIPPVAAALFGSTARGDSNAASDIDLILVRDARVDTDEPAWRQQVASLESAALSLTGNDARVVEYSDEEVRRLKGREKILIAAREEGVELFGSLSVLWSRRKRTRR